MKDTPLVIVNPAAGAGSAGRQWAKAATTLRHEIGTFECAFTRNPGDGGRIAELEAKAGRRRIVSFGGDGTISEIVGGILRAGTATELALLPQGTGADFLRSLGIPRRVAEAAHLLRAGVLRRVDVGKVRYTTPEGKMEERHFINSASFGLSGEVADHTNRSSKALGGTLTFARSTLSRALTFDPPWIQLEMNGEPLFRARVTTVCFTNGRFFGGGMKIAPGAELHDGLLDAIVITRLSLWKLMTRSPLLYTGAHLGLPEVHHRQLKHARAWPDPSTTKPVRVEVDGEQPGFLPAEFEICPSVLTVRAPRSMRPVSCAT